MHPRAITKSIGILMFSAVYGRWWRPIPGAISPIPVLSFRHKLWLSQLSKQAKRLNPLLPLYPSASVPPHVACIAQAMPCGRRMVGLGDEKEEVKRIKQPCCCSQDEGQAACLCIPTKPGHDRYLLNLSHFPSFSYGRLYLIIILRYAVHAFGRLGRIGLDQLCLCPELQVAITRVQAHFRIPSPISTNQGGEEVCCLMSG